MPETHDFTEFALGKKPPIHKRALMLRDVLTGVVPPIPTEADYLAGVPEWDLGRNDEFGTCGPTSVANSLRLVTQGLTGTMVTVTFDDIADLYRRSGNPDFDPAHPGVNDEGVVMQEMLEALLHGGIGGHKPLAFAKIAPNDMDTLDKAIAIFGAVNLGLMLTEAQMTQSVWRYAPKSPEWGGHAVLAGRYKNPAGTVADRSGIVTWAVALDMTHDFVAKQSDEAWVIIWPEHLGSKAFLRGVDVKALASAYEELTGRPFPAVPGPEPGPDTPPAPDPADRDADQALEEALRRFLTKKTGPRYLRDAARAWLASREG